MLTWENTKELLLIVADLYIEKEDELSKYDAVIGDGDHGITMARGAKAAKQKILELEEGSCRDYFKTYGRTLVSSMGGAMGPLFGSIFLEISKVCKDKEGLGVDEFYHGFKNAELKIIELGGASVGEKTMLDAIQPTVIALENASINNLSLKETMEKATIAAKDGLDKTIPMRAKRGRAKFLQDKSIGHQDAGATSFYYLIENISSYINTNGGQS